MSGVSSFRWRLGEYLEEHDISAYQLANAVGNLSRANSIYRLARKSAAPTSINLAILAEILEALEKTTDKPVNVSDILEFYRDDGSPQN